MTKLFDDIERTSMEYIFPGESQFRFLNRSAQTDKDKVRKLLESWFQRYPLEAQNSLRGRFRADDGQHHGAVFELMLHELFTRLGCQLEVLDIDGTTRRPDFLVQYKDNRCYVEATVVLDASSPFAPNPNEDDAIAKLKTLTSPHFSIEVEVEGTLSRALSKERVTQPFQDLLSKSDPDRVLESIEEDGPDSVPFAEIRDGTWILRGTLQPLSVEMRGDNDSRIQLFGPIRSAMVDPVTPVKRAVLEKARRYGELDAPLVVAVNVLVPSFDSRETEFAALFGREQVTYVQNRPDIPVELTREPDGVWVQHGPQPRYTRLYGVMMFNAIRPWNLSASVCLYLNPFVDDTGLPEALYRLSYAMGCDGEMKWFEGEDVGLALADS